MVGSGIGTLCGFSAGLGGLKMGMGYADIGGGNGGYGCEGRLMRLWERWFGCFEFCGKNWLGLLGMVSPKVGGLGGL